MACKNCAADQVAPKPVKPEIKDDGNRVSVTFPDGKIIHLKK